jgi:RNA polymerase sigma-70 factor (ECF subfamily)
MHTVLSQALDRDYPSRLTGGILELELYALLTKANRERLAGKLQAKAPGECQTFGACGQCAGEKLPVSSASSCEAWPSLLRLPLEEREALLLVALEGLSYSQACHVLRISRGILIARLARARGALSETAMKRSPFTPSKARPPYLRLVK